ncbi:MAG: DUF5677 domain-containing protein [Methanoregula sp.]|jgi:hypothetical protein|uniref:DUF5677 domain-containing protein n=1 Tax=Methanoregula sp. TaxID=2052170 RepID=UPI003D107BA9
MEFTDKEKENLEIQNDLKELENAVKNGENSSELQKRISHIIERSSNHFSEEEYDKIVENVSEKIQKNHNDMFPFYSLLEARWGKAIDLLEYFWHFSVETGQKFSDENFKNASDNKDLVFLTLKLLHGRACLVSGEIVTLLRNGYPDAAMARWRTLYEILIISDFIKKHGNNTANQYIEFEKIEDYQGIEVYQKCANKINKRPYSKEELNEIEERIKPLKEKYGDLIKNSYGWAFHDLKLSKNQKPSFKKIAETSDYFHYYPYYSWASYPVHSNSKSLTMVLGQPQYQKKVILAGPSDAAGIAEPGMMSGITLSQINIQFLSIYVTLPRLITMKTVDLLTKKIINEFYLASLNPIP